MTSEATQNLVYFRLRHWDPTPASFAPLVLGAKNEWAYEQRFPRLQPSDPRGRAVLCALEYYCLLELGCQARVLPATLPLSVAADADGVIGHPAVARLVSEQGSWFLLDLFRARLNGSAITLWNHDPDANSWFEDLLLTHDYVADEPGLDALVQFVTHATDDDLTAMAASLSGDAHTAPSPDVLNVAVGLETMIRFAAELEEFFSSFEAGHHLLMSTYLDLLRSRYFGNRTATAVCGRLTDLLGLAVVLPETTLTITQGLLAALGRQEGIDGQGALIPRLGPPRQHPGQRWLPS
ncbi:MAG: hypothetical protein AB7R55_09210 [Gemmatimonadales bacterium]